MENRKPSPKKVHSQEEKVIRQVKCDSLRARPGSIRKRLPIDSGALQNTKTQPQFQRVHVVVQPRSPAIKTLFVAENNCLSRKGSEKSRSLLAIGDHRTFCTHLAETRPKSARTFVGDNKKLRDQEIRNKRFYQTLYNQQVDRAPGNPNKDNTKLQPAEQCYVYTQHHQAHHHDLKQSFSKQSTFDKKNRKVIDAVAGSTNNNLSTSINQLNNRIKILKSLVRKQEMVLGDLNSHNSLSSSDESRDNMNNRKSGSARPGCSYIEHYSHIPETSAFHRYAQQSSSPSPKKGTTIEKEHNSEQYGRDFTAYDGLTARGRRQCNSATSKRDDIPQAAERMIKIRHKLNPVRDYRLMDTVHYLAQGEFAPRNDGIKLTPSREAVLSDIIWEDVCRTHWPTARLGRRHPQPDRCNTRNELQRLIDSLLRERVAHVERRRRRHYRIVKHTQHSAGRVGKTGDIIVASHKHKDRDENEVPTGHTHHASGLMMTSNKWPEQRSHRSDDRLVSPERRRVVQEECTPGPSYAAPRRREPTCCYHAAGPSRQAERLRNACECANKKSSSSSTASTDKHRKNPRLVVKKDPSRRKYHEKELNLEHFILLPTLVVRTPSNVRRQKKFNELYHRILNQLSTEQNTETQQPEYCQQNQDSATSIDHGKNKNK